MQELLFRVADGHLFYHELEACEQVNVDDVSNEEQLAIQQQQQPQGANNPAMATLSLPGPICMNGTDLNYSNWYSLRLFVAWISNDKRTLTLQADELQVSTGCGN